VLGDLTARIDWGYAKDYMECAWAMLQNEKADDYVISTGHTHSVRDFANYAFKIVNLNPVDHLETSDEFIRPTKTSELRGDSSKARSILGFSPKLNFKGLVEMMVNHDLKLNETYAKK